VSRRRVLNLPGFLHFVTFSTYQRRRFLDSPATRNITMEALEKCLTVHRVSCTGFVIMPNHVHTILSGDLAFRLETFLQVWKKTSSYRIKRFISRELSDYQRLCPDNCPIWQAGYYDFNIDTNEKLNEKLDYMHENPVRAELSQTASDWAWSSACFYECSEPAGVSITPFL
jgi:putative transposase